MNNLRRQSNNGETLDASRRAGTPDSRLGSAAAQDLNLPDRVVNKRTGEVYEVTVVSGTSWSIDRRNIPPRLWPKRIHRKKYGRWYR